MNSSRMASEMSDQSLQAAAVAESGGRDLVTRETYDVFISYSHNDTEYAQALAAFLENYGFVVWWDKKLLPGEKYRARINALIDECPAVISIWSPNSVESDWVMDEANRAA